MAKPKQGRKKTGILAAKSKKRPTRLEGFAKQHGFRVKTFRDADPGTLVSYKSKMISFDRGEERCAVICDPAHDHGFNLIFGGASRLKRLIRDTGIKKPLALTLMAGQRDVLFDDVGFDVPSYENGSGDPDDSASSNWGLLLSRLNIKYFTGDDSTITFLFPANDKAAITMAIALAKLPAKYDT